MMFDGGSVSRCERSGARTHASTRAFCENSERRRQTGRGEIIKSNKLEQVFGNQPGERSVEMMIE